MKAALPLVRLPANAGIYRFGTPTPAPRSSAILRFPSKGWTIRHAKGDGGAKQGWAVVGDAEGRRLAVEACSSYGLGEVGSLIPDSA